jgi:hypothetical protein
MESKAGFKLLFYRASLPENRFTLFRTHFRAYPLLMESKAGSKFLFCRASLPENRFTLFRTHFSHLTRLLETGQRAGRCCFKKNVSDLPCLGDGRQRQNERPPASVLRR